MEYKIMAEIRIDIWLADATTEIKLTKPEKLKDIFKKKKKNEQEILLYKALAEHFLDTLNRMNKLIR